MRVVFVFVLMLGLMGFLIQNASAMTINDEAFLELCESGTLQEIEDAIKSGADVNARTRNGTTALMFAATGSNPEIITMLLKNGADANLENRNGRRAIDYAKGNENLENTDVFRELNGRSYVEK